MLRGTSGSPRDSHSEQHHSVALHPRCDAGVSKVAMMAAMEMAVLRAARAENHWSRAATVVSFPLAFARSSPAAGPRQLLAATLTSASGSVERPFHFIGGKLVVVVHRHTPATGQDGSPAGRGGQRRAGGARAGSAPVGPGAGGTLSRRWPRPCESPSRSAIALLRRGRRRREQYPASKERHRRCVDEEIAPIAMRVRILLPLPSEEVYSHAAKGNGRSLCSLEATGYVARRHAHYRGRAWTSRFMTSTCTGSPFWFSVVVRHFTKPWPGRLLDARTSSTSDSTRSSSPGRTGRGHFNSSARVPMIPPAGRKPLSTSSRMVSADVCHPLAARPPKNEPRAASSSR